MHQARQQFIGVTAGQNCFTCAVQLFDSCLDQGCDDIGPDETQIQQR